MTTVSSAATPAAESQDFVQKTNSARMSSRKRGAGVAGLAGLAVTVETVQLRSAVMCHTYHTYAGMLGMLDLTGETSVCFSWNRWNLLAMSGVSRRWGSPDGPVKLRRIHMNSPGAPKMNGSSIQ